MRRRRVSFSVDPRRTALKRAGWAVTAALILLLVVLWFGDGDPPPSEPENADLVQPDVPAPQAEPPALSKETTAQTASEPVEVPAPDSIEVPTPVELPTSTPVPAPVAKENKPVPSTIPLVSGGTAQNTKIPKATEPQTAAPQYPPKKAATAPVKPVSLSNGYFVQLGVFNDTDNVGKVFDNTTALGLPAHIQSRVVVGPFRNKREAEAARNRLRGIAEGIVLPPEKTAKANGKPKAKSKPRRRAR
ncbi:MAG: SPOR domain-containing protein [Proteobacteria bacterium]|nr:SPOR domain-containing protein [Pseudomonadota bacterium]